MLTDAGKEVTGDPDGDGGIKDDAAVADLVVAPRAAVLVAPRAAAKRRPRDRLLGGRCNSHLITRRRLEVFS